MTRPLFLCLWIQPLGHHRTGVQISDVTAFAPCCRVDHGIDQGRFAGSECFGDGLAQFVGIGCNDTDTAKGLHHKLVFGVFDKDGCRRVLAPTPVFSIAAIDAVVVEDNDADRKVVAADGFHLHAGESKGTVTLDTKHLIAGLDSRRDSRSHADPHDAPGADIEPLAGLVDVDDGPALIQRIRAFVEAQRLAYADRSLWLDWDQLPAQGLETRLSWLCYWVLECERNREEYGLRLPGVTIEPGGGDKHRDRVLKELALFRSGDARES